MNSSQQQPSPGRGHGDPSHITPFLPPLVTQPQGVAQNGGRPRKSAKAKMQGRIREDRRRELEEPRFNIAVPTSPRSRKPQQRTPRPPAAQTMVPFSRDTMIPDEPPPSFQEAISERSPPPFNVVSTAKKPVKISSPLTNTERFPEAVATTSSPATTSPAVVSPGPTLNILPDTAESAVQIPSHSPSPLTPSSQQTITPSENSDNASDSSSIEVVDLNQSQDEADRRLGLSQEWQADRRRGLPLKVRIQRDLKRQQHNDSTTGPSSSSPHRGGEDITAGSHAPCPQPPHHCSQCGRPKPSQCDAAHFSTRYSPGSGDIDNSPPMSPRGGRFTWKKLFAPMVASDRAGPSSPVMSPRSPLTGRPSPWASTLTLGLTNPTPASKSLSLTPPHKRKDSFSVKKLFASKGKEREEQPDGDVGESWEVLDDSSLPSDSDSGSGRTGNEAIVHRTEAPPAGNPRVDPPPHSRVSPVPAFLERPVRHSPAPMLQPLFSGSTSNLLSNHSSLNLPETPQASPRLGQRTEPYKPKMKHVSPLLSSALGEATASSSVSLPSMVAKGTSHPDTTNTALTVAPLSPRQRSRSEGRHAVPRPELRADSPTTQITPIQAFAPTNLDRSRQSPARTRSPTLPALSVPPASRHASPRIYILSDEDLDDDLEGATSSSPEENSVSPVTPTYIRDGKHVVPRVTDTRRPSPSSPRARSTSPFIGSSPVQESPPRTPTTPTHHHYPGRPLPHPPSQPSPRMAAPAIVTIAPPELPDYGAPHHAYAELDHVASQLVEDEHKGHIYEETYTEPPSPLYAEPSYADVPGQRLSTVGRVERGDNRVKVKLILMGREVDKCRICFCQFKEDELAVYGMNCDHV
ncbi:hypothetical protein EIP86_002672 [Pleurotus ostreatoroseus]|nr:hypothetical protein EIP86_002672 [Pleurotus ostreatoroseus]